jgi:hypothetical protein
MNGIFKIMAVALNERKNNIQDGSKMASLIFKMDAWRPENRSNCENEKTSREHCPYK